MNTAPLFSIIIPTCQRPTELRLCLQGIQEAANQAKTVSYEVIVSDDSPSCAVYTKLKEDFKSVNWLNGPRKGPACNRNFAAKNSKGSWLIFLDDDCIPDKEWLTAYNQSIEQISNEVLVFEGRIYAQRPQESLAETAPLNENGGNLWSCNFAIQTELYNKLGGFDERFPYAAMEDVELCYRLREQGIAIQFVPKAAVCHPWRIKGGWKEFKRHQEATLIYLAIHPQEKKRINAKYYVYIALAGFVRHVLPRVLKGKLAGVKMALLEYFSYLYMALRLFLYTKTISL